LRNLCGLQGDDMLHEIYYNIGKVEVEDQIDVTTQLVNLYPFIGEFLNKIESGRMSMRGGSLLASIGGHFTAKIQALLHAAVAHSLKWCKPLLPLLAPLLVLALQFAFLLLLAPLRFVYCLLHCCCVSKCANFGHVLELADFSVTADWPIKLTVSAF
jgi:hypothetical protein